MSRRPRPIVSIDGPAGAGKSTVAKRLAEAIGFVVVDTGALYRAVALGAARAGLAWTDPGAVGAYARSLIERAGLSFTRDPEGRARVLLNEEDVTDAIRGPDIAMGASTVSAHPAVRAALLDLQRHAGREGGVVLEGRDIGTVVFPDAELKFFLTARAEVRAARRLAELRAKGQQTTFEETLDEVVRRDTQDTTRATAPLRQAPDAVLIDNSDMTIDGTVARMVERVGRWSPA
ncbi:MAG TPA: (d)CMP kinase [Polyangiaceae bacterium]|nr:(d)CMP kinase [Polyangiaceae bacterium]